MQWIEIQGVDPYDGRYEFDIAATTIREWSWIKRLAGYLSGTIGDGLEGGDLELLVTFAAIALHRAGRVETDRVPELYQRLLDTPSDGAIRLLSEDEPEVEVNPSPPNSRGSEPTSAPNGKPNLASSETTPPDTGTPASATSESHREWSAT